MYFKCRPNFPPMPLLTSSMLPTKAGELASCLQHSIAAALWEAFLYTLYLNAMSHENNGILSAAKTYQNIFHFSQCLLYRSTLYVP